SDEPMKNAKGENIIIPLPDGTITFQYKVPDTIYYSFDFDQISLKYEGTDKTPTTIQLLKKSSKRSYVLAEFPTKLLCEKQLVTYERIDPVNEKKYIDQYLKHVENTKIRFNKDGLSRLIIKYPRKYYYDEYTFFDNFMFDSQYTIEEQKTKLESILRMPVNVIYDSIRYSLTNNYGEDSVIRDPKLGDLISVFKIKIDTSFSINEVHSLYRKQLINYNPESEMFEITDQTIFICIDDVKEGKLIIDQVNSKPYPTSMANKEIDLALKYDLNNNPLRDLLKPYYIHIQLVNLDQLYQVKTPKQKKSKTTLVVEQITL
ncbi:hypothetical protein, partial [uncultured Fluviicola sp.]|uniref:hypothetical protein n=1 Tax=uncultured Fluviicola sp. TaxID=463303 RepID=UPI0025FB70CA